MKHTVSKIDQKNLSIYTETYTNRGHKLVNVFILYYKLHECECISLRKSVQCLFCIVMVVFVCLFYEIIDYIYVIVAVCLFILYYKLHACEGKPDKKCAMFILYCYEYVCLF